MPTYEVTMNWEKYHMIATAIGAGITGINLLRGYYTKHTIENARDYSNTDIVVTSVKKGIIFGSMWPVTGILTFSGIIEDAMKIGLHPSNQIFYPIDMYKLYYKNRPHCCPVIKDDNEVSEETEKTDVNDMAGVDFVCINEKCSDTGCSGEENQEPSSRDSQEAESQTEEVESI